MGIAALSLSKSTGRLLREGRTTRETPEVQKLRHMTGWGFWLRVETVLGLFSTELNMGFSFGTILGTIRRPWGACWMVAEGGEGEKPSPFSKRGGGGGGAHLRSSRFSRHPKVWKRPRPLVGRAPSPGGPGPKRPGDLAHRPLGPVFAPAFQPH